MATARINLHDGIDLSSVEFNANRSDTTFFVHAGGVAFLTNNGTRRMGVVPVQVGEAYLRAKQTSHLSATQAAEALDRGTTIPHEVAEAWASAQQAGIDPKRFTELVNGALGEELADRRLTNERLSSLVEPDGAGDA